MISPKLLKYYSLDENGNDKTDTEVNKNNWTVDSKLAK